MDRQQASHIVKNTFENPFEKTRYTLFIKNLLNKIEDAPFTYKGNYIPDAFEEYVTSLERIGKYSDGENNIDILIVQLKKETSIERGRTMQRNFIARYLNGSRGGEMKDAALVAFVSPNTDDWRFSLVKMEYRFEQAKSGKIKVKEEFTPARRWSFLVGANENSHTAQSRLVPGIADDEHNPTLSELEEAFNIEKVTREFFEKYCELFIWTKDELDKVLKINTKIRDDFENKNVNTVDFAKKLIGQIIFLYFLQKKGWFGVQRDAEWGTGSKKFLRELFVQKHGKFNNFFNDILEPLFYEALRIDRSHDDHYYSRFNCKIPFLNGGLFDPMNNYDWVHTDVLLPNELFSNTHKTKEGDTGNGILDIFDRYNFTVKEDEPLEKEVAIDPELLGKAYEKFNAIRPDNYQEYLKALKSGKKGEESKFNKQYGVYYTPREIVHYMCQQSLINYLYTELNDGIVVYRKLAEEQTDMFLNKGKSQQLDLTIENRSKPVIPKDDIETLIHYGEHVSENEAQVEKAGKETARYYYKLPESIRMNAQEIDQKLAEIKVCDPAIGSGAFPVGMMSEIVRARNALTPFIKNDDRSIYRFKRKCIENSLYGVDIDSGAVEIAKLRLWLSLVVDEDDIKQIKPLPNLDYKIVCGNSLLGIEKGKNQLLLFSDELLRQMEEMKNLEFNETNPTKKLEYKTQIDGLINQITSGHSVFDFEAYFSEVFHEKGGFDVVIGNPPYVEHKKLKGISSKLKGIYTTYSGTADLYVYFYEKGIRILRQNGSLFYITSNKFIKTSYGDNLRKYFTNFHIIEIIDFTEVHVFEALVASCILCISKRKVQNNNIIIAFANDSLVNFTDLKAYIDKSKFHLNQNNLSSKIWQLETNAKLLLKEKIESSSVTINNAGTINIYRGVTTGYNPAFIIDDEKRKELIEEDKRNKPIIKRLLQGRNIRKWSYIKTNDYMIFTRKGIQIRDFPSIKKYLQKYKQQLEPGIGRKPGSYNWYEIQDNTAYYQEFDKEKLIWGLTADKWAFAYDSDKHYLPSNGYILTSNEIPVKYLLALLNSRLMEFYFGFIGIMTAGGAFTLKYETVVEFPIKMISKGEQKAFIEVVNRILSLTQSEDYRENTLKQENVKECEKEIDRLVYDLYGLTEEEIKMVEGEKS